MHTGQQPYDVIIIGGGLSGLSAAVDLASRGISVLVLEQRRHLGGRTYSFVDERTGDVVDNGQHLMMGCYANTRWYLRTIGADRLASLQSNLHLDFLHPERGKESLVCPPLPAPVHVLWGLLGLKSLSFSNRLKLLRIGVEVQRAPSSVEPRLISLTVDEWLNKLYQPAQNKDYLWNVLAIGSLNDDPKKVSALLFYRVLRAAFHGSRENCSMLVPRVGLSELFVEPSVRYVHSHRGETKTDCGVEEVLREGDRLVALRCSDGTVKRAGAYISAIPPYALASLLEPHTDRSESADGFESPATALRALAENLRAFEHSPIITINLWLDRELVQEEFLALLECRIHWIFNKSRIFNLSGRSYQYLSLVMSGAADYAGMDKEKLVELAVEDLRKVLPKMRASTVIHALVIKEKRATFSPKPGVESLRPTTTTPLENLFLAGDWTDTGYPATIEGAVMSGRIAADRTAAFFR